MKPFLLILLLLPACTIDGLAESRVGTVIKERCPEGKPTCVSFKLVKIRF